MNFISFFSCSVLFLECGFLLATRPGQLNAGRKDINSKNINGNSVDSNGIMPSSTLLFDLKTLVGIFGHIGAYVDTTKAESKKYSAFRYKFMTSVVDRFCKEEYFLTSHQNKNGSPVTDTKESNAALHFSCLNFALMSCFTAYERSSRYQNEYPVPDVQISQETFIQKVILDFMKANKEHLRDVCERAASIKSKSVRDILIAFIRFMEWPESDKLLAGLINTWSDILFDIPKSKDYAPDSDAMRQHNELKTPVTSLFGLVNDLNGNRIAKITTPVPRTFDICVNQIIASLHSEISQEIRNIEDSLCKLPLEFKSSHFDLCKYTQAVVSIIKSIYLFSAVRDRIDLTTLEDDGVLPIDKAVIFCAFDYGKLSSFLLALPRSSLDDDSAYKQKILDYIRAFK